MPCAIQARTLLIHSVHPDNQTPVFPELLKTNIFFHLTYTRYHAEPACTSTATTILVKIKNMPSPLRLGVLFLLLHGSVATAASVASISSDAVDSQANTTTQVNAATAATIANAATTESIHTLSVLSHQYPHSNSTHEAQRTAQLTKRKLHGRFLHITDLHPDEFYKFNTAVGQFCHRKAPKKGEDSGERAGWFGVPFR